MNPGAKLDGKEKVQPHHKYKKLYRDRKQKTGEKFMAEQISIERQQCRMLIEAIKKIVTNPRTPNWIKNPLETAVKEAKTLKPSETISTEENAPEPAKNEIIENVDLDVGVLCIDALDPGDKCMYEIIRRSLEVDHVQLWDVRVTKGDKRTPAGIIMHNVPSTYLRGVRLLGS